MSFAELSLAAPLLRAIEAEGYTTPTPIQAAAIPPLVAGRDLLGCAQTGTGKTAAFALPILQRLAGSGNPPKGSGRRIRALILAPTRELAAQISASFQAYGRFTSLRQVVIYGGVGQHPQVRALQKGVDIVIATPGRLVDLINQGHVDLRHVNCFVLDEADRMLDMGFLPDLRRIIARLPVERQTLLFSATMPPAIEQLAQSSLRDPVEVRIAPERVTGEGIEQSVLFVPQARKVELLVELLARQAVARGIVFTRTKHGADKVVKQLEKAGVRAEAMHGNKSQSARQRTLAAFKSQHPPIVVATDLAARGIDVSGVSHVFNFDLPVEAETYVHRIGRTARAGASGVAIAFCDPGERGLLRDIERLLRRSLTVEAIEGLTLDSQSAPAAHGGQSRQRSQGQRPQGQRRGQAPRRFERGRSNQGRSGQARSGNGHAAQGHSNQGRTDGAHTHAAEARPAGSGHAPRPAHKPQGGRKPQGARKSQSGRRFRSAL